MSHTSWMQNQPPIISPNRTFWYCHTQSQQSISFILYFHFHSNNISTFSESTGRVPKRTKTTATWRESRTQSARTTSGCSPLLVRHLIDTVRGEDGDWWTAFDLSQTYLLFIGSHDSYKGFLVSDTKLHIFPFCSSSQTTHCVHWLSIDLLASMRLLVGSSV